MDTHYSDDYFKTKKMAVEGGNSLVVSDAYIFVAQSEKEYNGRIKVMASHFDTGYEKFVMADIPYKSIAAHSFTVIDSTEFSSFLHIQHRG